MINLENMKIWRFENDLKEDEKVDNSWDFVASKSQKPEKSKSIVAYLLLFFYLFVTFLLLICNELFSYIFLSQ